MQRVLILIAFGLLATAPATAAEPVLWLDASAEQSLVHHGDGIGRWTSLAKTDRTLVQPDNDYRPTVGNKLAGKPTLHFDGNDFMEGDPILAAGDDTFTIVALWRPHRLAIQSVFEQAGPGRGGRAALLQVGERYGFNGEANDFHNAVKLAANQWRLTAIVVTGEASENVIVIDNDQPPAVGSIDMQTQNVGVARMLIGTKVFGDESFRGDLAELRVYDSALAKADLTAELKALTEKWILDFKSVVPEIATEPMPSGPFVYEPTAEHFEFFENKVRPLLAEHCYQCHSEKAERLEGGLRLDARPLALTGGDSGAAVVPGNPSDSLMIDAVLWKSYEMPPKGKLKPEEIATLTKWVELGAPWPASDQPIAASEEKGYDWEHWRNEHWAFQPVEKPEPPSVVDMTWPASDLDRFVLSRLEQAELPPSKRAEPQILVRRVYFTLIGLPPTPAQAEAFVAAWERNPNAAMETLVDELLASPLYGQRWARHWLDVARYSDGHGGFLDNDRNDAAWRYRDWVVDALNHDMPYDQFLRLQIAGDLTDIQSNAIATGFFALGPTYRSDGGDPDSVAQAKAETLSDRLDTLSRGMLGLTLACARCHDHKFDPLPQQDYYSLAGIFNNTAKQEAPLAAQAEIDAYHQRQQEINEANKRLNDLRNKIKQEKREPSGEEQGQLDRWQQELDELRKTAPAKFATAHALRDSGSGDMPIAIRGNLRKPGDPAPRRFLRVLAGDERPRFDDGSGRKQLAEAIADPANPLTTRVIVNRVWMHHFGKALVRTPSNFGALGEEPTHPALLDWLTASFVESGMSLKALHRTILLSSTYQMSSDLRENAFAVDGDNRLLWRMNPRRLDVEAFRDALLATTDELNTEAGGPPTDDINTPRRTLYFKVSRNGDVFRTDEFLRRFDFPMMRATIDKRPKSIVPQQFLFLMNSPFMVDRARKLADRLASHAEDNEDRIRFAYELLYQRPASEAELAIGESFLVESIGEADGLPPWVQYAQVLLSANEFMYVK